MIIKVRLFANFRAYGKGEGQFEKGLPKGSSLGDLIKDLGLPPEAPKVVLLNGRRVPLDQELTDGDEVTVFPPVEGG